MKDKKVALVVLLGPPGSGKGTQAKRLNEKHPSWLHISTGDLFRKEIATGSPLGLNLKNTLAAGQLVTDELTNSVFESQMAALINELNPEVLLLDGYPRTEAQARFLKGLFESLQYPLLSPVVIEVDVPLDVLVKRLSGRWINPRNGRIYHELSNPPKKPGICDEDGQPLVQRDDDKPEVIKKRYKSQYQDQRERILGVLAPDPHKVKHVNGNDRMEGVTLNLERIVGALV